MRNSITVCLVVIVLVWLSATASAQDNGIFSGHGARFLDEKKPQSPKSKWPKLLDFSKDETPAPMAMPFSDRFNKKPSAEKPTIEKPSLDWFKKKPSSLDGRKSPKPFSGLTDLFPKRDPNRPTLLEKMNTKSKHFFDRTTSWTQKKNQELRDKSFSTWDAITKDLRAYQAETDHKTIPAQPPVRTAEALGKPRVRF